MPTGLSCPVRSTRWWQRSWTLLHCARPTHTFRHLRIADIVNAAQSVNVGIELVAHAYDCRAHAIVRDLSALTCQLSAVVRAYAVQDDVLLCRCARQRDALAPFSLTDNFSVAIFLP